MARSAESSVHPFFYGSARFKKSIKKPSRLGLCVLSLLLGSVPLFCQKQSAHSDPEAVALASRAMAALTGGNVINDVTLVGSATWRGDGNDESGTATLKALGTAESRIDISLPGGARTEIRDASSGTTQGLWINPNGKSGKFAYHNTLTDAAWFFPQLGSLAGGREVILKYIGQETRNELTVEHLRSYMRDQGGQKQAVLLFEKLNAMDFYLDANTMLPVAIIFNVHPDNNANANLLTEVDFSEYQKVDGISAPLHIQKFVQGNLFLDISVAKTLLNTGLGLAEFSIKPEERGR